MKSQSHLFPIILMARLLRVSVSRFYAWLKRGMSKRSIQRSINQAFTSARYQNKYACCAPNKKIKSVVL